MAVKSRGKNVMKIPEYTSGCFDLCKKYQDKVGDYPVECLISTGYEIWYREIAVFDKTRYKLEQGGKEITKKIRIPQYKDIGTGDVCLMDGKQHLVYNAAHITDKDGNPETELTLIRPGKELEIHE